MKRPEKSPHSKETERLRGKYRSTTHFVLSSLLPYTESNLKLTFRPTAFFKDLENISGGSYSASAVSASYYRAVGRGLMSIDEKGNLELTSKGVSQLRRYEPKKLKGAASVLVIFDIPEEQRHLRRRLRMLLREFHFVLLQQSVWQSEYDVVEYLVPEIEKQGLASYLQIHETVRIV